jgi:cytochrome c553
MSRAFQAVLVGTGLLLCACSSNEPSAPSAQREAPKAAPVPPSGVPEQPASEESLALHMRDHLGITTQARDAIIRGQLVEATGPLTWLAQHREPKAAASAHPFLEHVHQHAQRALDAPDLPNAAAALAGLAAACGDCHRAHGRGPKPEPSGFEDLDGELTVENHMHGYLWATETLWNALIADPALWKTGVATMATLKPPARPRRLAAGFTQISSWAEGAASADTSAERAQAYGLLIAICGTCHIANAVVPGRTP